MTALDCSVAVRRYLQRHIEPGLPAPPAQARWGHALVIPAYREPATLLETLQAVPRGRGRILVILVLNRPDSDPDTSANDALRDTLGELPPARAGSCAPACLTLAEHADLLVLDLERSAGPTPQAQGVGLARKYGCDLALRWIKDEAIRDQWIYCTDADVTLPDDYFLRLEETRAPAALFPFRHRPGADAQCFAATALYEQHLHHYVGGLDYAGSPYAFHTLGSCIAVGAEAYAQVRGFPRRAGAEDFYLLNKLAKLAPVLSMAGEPVKITARRSDRVPFGTGPAVASIMDGGPLDQQHLFYAPQVFDALRAILACVPLWWRDPGAATSRLLQDNGIAADMGDELEKMLAALGLQDALAHCRRQAKDAMQFERQFHQWFDGFRTLKLIHQLTDSFFPRLSLAELEHCDVKYSWISTPSGKAQA